MIWLELRFVFEVFFCVGSYMAWLHGECIDAVKVLSILVCVFFFALFVEHHAECNRLIGG